MKYQCPQCGLPRTGNQAMGLAMPQCICSWQFTPPQTPQPKRTWVGLTDEEIAQGYETTGHYQTLRPQDKFAVYALARAIEAKLKEKNT